MDKKRLVFTALLMVGIWAFEHFEVGEHLKALLEIPVLGAVLLAVSPVVVVLAFWVDLWRPREGPARAL